MNASFVYFDSFETAVKFVKDSPYKLQKPFRRVMTRKGQVVTLWCVAVLVPSYKNMEATAEYA